MSTGHEIAMGLRAAYLAMHRRSDAALAGKEGVTVDQFVVLAVLSDQDRITQQTLARRTSSDPNTIGAMLALLERRRLVERRTHPTDRRARSVVLTRRGHQTLARLRARSEGVRQRLERLFNPMETRTLIECLGRITRQLAADTEYGQQNRLSRKYPKRRGRIGKVLQVDGRGAATGRATAPVPGP
jgi:DNA-binding MarR family transcriptional regulator